jgi:flagellar protein FlaJ
MDYARAFYSLNKSLAKYIFSFALPIIGIGIAVMVSLLYFFPRALGSGFALYLVYAIPIYCLLFTFIYPFLLFERKKNQIDQNMHFFITHLGVLATSDISRKDLFKILSKKKEYEELARECEKIYLMMDVWHMSLAEACRFLAKRTPSSIFADFLDRFAHAVESGTDLEEFLKSEQKVVMNDYAVMYRGALYDIDIIKEMLISIIISMVFFVCFAIIMPFLTGQDPVVMMGISTFMFVVIELFMLFFIKSKVPKDQVWHSINMKTPIEVKFKRAFLLSMGCCLAVALIVFLEGRFLPLAIKLALAVTPLLYIGFVAKKEEALVRRRDESYAEFIRSLGASADARGGILESALKYLTSHDFGVLTQNIRDLYNRLMLRIDKLTSWRYFAAESGSNLIQRFSEMFIEALHIGGRPYHIGLIISNNFVDLSALRRQRFQTTASLIGIMYGLQAGLTFSLYISYGVVKMMNSMFSNIELPREVVGSILFVSMPWDLEIISILLLVIIIAHSVISAVAIRVVDGGHIFSSLTHFVIMMWIGSIVAVVTETLLNSMLAIQF